MEFTLRRAGSWWSRSTEHPVSPCLWLSWLSEFLCWPYWDIWRCSSWSLFVPSQLTLHVSKLLKLAPIFVARRQWTVGASSSIPNETRWIRMAGVQFIGGRLASGRLAAGVRLKSFSSPNSIVPGPNLSIFAPTFRSAVGSERRCSFVWACSSSVSTEGTPCTTERQPMASSRFPIQDFTRPRRASLWSGRAHFTGWVVWGWSCPAPNFRASDWSGSSNLLGSAVTQPRYPSAWHRWALASARGYDLAPSSFWGTPSWWAWHEESIRFWGGEKSCFYA